MKYLLTTLLISFTLILNAQKPPIKFGKGVTVDNLKMTVYPKDSSASAVILCDYGTSKIDYSNDGFYVVFERTLRIKILNKNGLDWANHEISYYDTKSESGEEVNSLKGLVYNLNKGKIEITKLSKDGIFDSRDNEYWNTLKLSLPQVSEGSILDITYEIKSPYLRQFRDWQFQYSIPSVWSEYRADLIEYYKYQKFMQGYLSPTINESERGTQSFSVRNETQVQATPGYNDKRTSTSYDSYQAGVTKNRWVIKDVPAFYDEPHMTSRENYVSKINFQLVGKQFPSRPYEDMLGSWETVNDTYLKSEYFYKKIEGSNFLKEEMVAVIATANAKSEYEKALAIHKHLVSSVSWNGFNSKSSGTSFREIIKEKKGSAADMNLLLVSMLQKAGISAEPVMVSTRNNGFVQTQYPVVDQFNYVICKAVIDGEQYLIDATDFYTPMGGLPEKCLNGQGLAITPSGHAWIDLIPSYKDEEKIMISASLENEQLSGSMERRYEGYAARDIRANFYSDSTDFKESYANSLDWEITNMKTSDFEKYSGVPSITTDFSAELESSGPVTYLSPVLVKRWDSNPFKLKQRDYPVDFSAPKSFTYLMNLSIPDGSVIEEIPESKVIALPNKGGTFRYTITVQGNDITIINQLKIAKTLFNQEEYLYLKEFFEQMIQMQEQLIVIKKS